MKKRVYLLDELQPRFKEVIDPVTAGIVIGGSALLGGLNLFGQKSANDTNLTAVRETNRQNRELFNEQLAFTEKMWNQNNEYNTPEAQRARYEAAGINPYMALGNINSGSATMASTPSAPQMQAGHVEPLRYGDALGAAAKDAILTYDSLRMHDAQVSGQQLQNKVLSAQANLANAKAYEELLSLQRNNRLKLRQSNLSEVQKVNLEKEGKVLDYQLKRLSIESQYYDSIATANNESAVAQASLHRQTAINMQLQNEYQRLFNHLFPKLTYSQISSLSASAAAAAESVNESESRQRLNTYEQKVKYYQALGYEWDNLIKSGQVKLQDLSMSQAELDAMKAGTYLQTYKNSPNFYRFDFSLEHTLDLINPFKLRYPK